MARRVEGATGQANVVLPGGWVLDEGDTVVITDEEWAKIQADDLVYARLDDLGHTTDTPTPVPSYRDLQRAVAGGSTGLEGEVEALQGSVAAHIADTTAVHGIPDTTKLAWNQNVVVTGAANGEVLTYDSGTWSPTPLPTSAEPWMATYNFASAIDTWLISHGQDTYAIHIETFDNDDNPIEGNVIYDTANQAHVEFYYPTSGYARAWSN